MLFGDVKTLLNVPIVVSLIRKSVTFTSRYLNYYYYFFFLRPLASSESINRFLLFFFFFSCFNQYTIHTENNSSGVRFAAALLTEQLTPVDLVLTSYRYADNK